MIQNRLCIAMLMLAYLVVKVQHLNPLALAEMRRSGQSRREPSVRFYPLSCLPVQGLSAQDSFLPGLAEIGWSGL